MAGSYVGAVGIGVSDLARSVDFYTRVLGMKVLQTFKLAHMDEAVVGFEGRGSAIVLMHWTDGSERSYKNNPIKIVLYVDDSRYCSARRRGRTFSDAGAAAALQAPSGGHQGVRDAVPGERQIADSGAKCVRHRVANRRQRRAR